MCGIAGVLTCADRYPPDLVELRAMAAMLGHRGPDGHGFFLDRRAGIGLAHVRLALIDLPGGDQPIRNEDGSLWMVGSGEVFDHEEQRTELRRRGHAFRTASDMEVLLHAYEEWGAHAFERLDAQFAVAFWDRRIGRLVLARDRFGILPLWYAETPDGIVFASEQKALFSGARIGPEFDARVVRQVFTYWAAPGPDSVFAGVRSIPTATLIAFGPKGEADRRTWWRPDFRRRIAIDSAPEAGRGLGTHLDRAVRRRLSADVPVGTYLSGGLDSAVVLALAAHTGRKPVTFSLEFEEEPFDESEAQHRLVAFFGTEHHAVRCTAADVRSRLADVVWHCESPILRTAPVPMFVLSGLVHRHGIKAVLTGEGADELLGGYSIFQEDKVRRFVARRPDSPRRAELFGRVHEFVGERSTRDSHMWQAFLGRDRTGPEDPYRTHRARWQNGRWTTRVLSTSIDGDEGDAAIDAVMPPDDRMPTPLARAQAIECATFMSPYLLSSQGDRVALAHGVEVRYPFLAPDVVDYCCSLEDRHKLCGLTTKVALRRLAADLLPEEVWRRKKHPYRAPIASALAERSGDLLDGLLEPGSLRDEPLLDAKAAERLLAKIRRDPTRASERENMALCGLATLRLLRWQFFDHFEAHVAERTDDLARETPRVCEIENGPIQKETRS